MGVPFEALIPYAIMLGVRLTPPTSNTEILIPSLDVRHHWGGPFENKTHAEWRKESKAFARSVG